MNVLVLMGGVSPERDVSLDSGAAVCQALETAGHNVIGLDTGADAKLPEIGTNVLSPAVKPDPPDMRELTRLDRQFALKSITAESLRDVDVVFIALHGGAGENGEIQALLELAGVAYTGSQVLASALAMDKDMSKKVFRSERIPTPKWVMVGKTVDGDYSEYVAVIAENLGYPVIVKPSDAGSTVGLSLVKSETDLIPALQHAAEFSGRIMAEEYISGRELTVGVLDGKALPVVEIIPSHELYDYECKYLPGKSEYVVPAEIDDDLRRELQAYSEQAFDALDCAGYARVDFRVDPESRPYCLEVNTLPGMTTTSLVPKAARAAGMSFEKLVERICEEAVERRIAR